MPSYLVTGANRGIGFGYLRAISSNPEDVVIGIVRDKAAADKKVAEELPGRPNVHIVEAQIADYESLKASVPKVAEITGGSLDYIISNAAINGTNTTTTDIVQKPELLEKTLFDNLRVNVLAPINLFMLYLPLIRKGTVKKIAYISSGMADVDAVARFKFPGDPVYAMGKAAGNVAVAKLDAEFSNEGILFMSISPGLVMTSAVPTTPEEDAAMQQMMKAFADYAPDWKGPISVEVSSNAVLSVLRNASVEKGDGGSFVSHWGNKQWL